MKDQMKKGISVLLTASLACMVPLPALAEESKVLPAPGVADTSAMVVAEDAEMDAAVQELIASSFKAGAAVDELSKATGGAMAIDFADLPQAPNDEAWIKDAEAYLDSLAASSPQTSADEAQSSEMDAQSEAVSYALACAEWSVREGRSNDIASEAVYMYISHYIDVGSNYWSAGSVDYLLDGPARSDVQPFFCKWLQPADREVYATYINATGGTKHLAEIGNIAIGAAGIVGTANDVRRAASSLGKISEEGYRSSATVSMLSMTYDAATLSGDIGALADSISVAMSNDPERKVSEIAEDYIANSDILAKYDQEAKEAIAGIVLGMGAAALLAGAPIAAVGAGAVGLVASAASISLHMASDFYSYVAWLAMRYGWSTRYSMRLYENLFG